MLVPPGRRLFVLAVLVTVALGVGAPSNARDLPAPLAALTGAQIRPGDTPGSWVIGEWRESQVTLAPFGFRISLTWNGIDDQDWPFERLVAGIASNWCGGVTPDMVKRRVESLYRSRSLVPEKDLGGNGGVTFKKRLTVDLGRCRAEFLAEGARWHRLGAVVYLP